MLTQQQAVKPNHETTGASNMVGTQLDADTVRVHVPQAYGMTPANMEQSCGFLNWRPEAKF
jgi:hypothetical protein